jgi:tRNA threonylcarbamoyl adenosine modification protein (Sua5/YciO/YrdC/YwlC family)
MAEIGKDIKKAKFLLESGELVAIPTETVYGLAANALNVTAVTKIFEVKQRPSFDPLIVHVHDIKAAEQYAEHIPEKAIALTDKFWPGPLTIVLKKKTNYSRPCYFRFGHCRYPLPGPCHDFFVAEATQLPPRGTERQSIWICEPDTPRAR